MRQIDIEELINLEDCVERLRSALQMIEDELRSQELTTNMRDGPHVRWLASVRPIVQGWGDGLAAFTASNTRVIVVSQSLKTLLANIRGVGKLLDDDLEWSVHQDAVNTAADETNQRAAKLFNESSF